MSARARLAALPVMAILYLVIVQHYALAPSALYGGRIPRALVDAWQDPTHVLRQTLVVVGHGALIVAGLQLLCARLPGRRGRGVGLALLALHAALLEVWVYHYLKLGAYPSLLVIQDFVTDPLNVTSYVAAGMTRFDRVVVAGTLVVLVLLSALALRALPDAASPTTWRDTGAAGLVALLLGTALGWVPAHQSLEMQGGNGLPSYAWHTGVRFLVTGRPNDLRAVEAFVPRIPPQGRPAEVSPQHIVVVIADSLRDDHTPFGGYPRDTLPRLWAEREAWIRFPRAYSPGASTRTSLPPLFNGIYLAELDTVPRGAHTFWGQLRDTGAHTALFSTSNLAWAHIAQKSGFAGLDEHFTAKDPDAWQLTQHDGSEDAELVDAFEEMLGRLPEGTRTVSFVYLLATHFPYYVPPAYRHFEPNFYTVDNAYTYETFTVRVGGEVLENSYDNGTLYIDHHVGRILDALEANGTLDRSLVVLTGDHGEAFEEHDSISHGRTLYEEQIHVPLLIRVGADLPELQRRLSGATDRIVGLVDLPPTLVALSGARPDPVYQGLSWLADEGKPYELVVCRHLKEKLAVVTHDRKYWFDGPAGRAHAFDLRADPKELNDLWTAPVRTVDDFLAELASQGAIAP